MKISKITANFNGDISTVWDIVTNNNNHSWRSDLKSIKIQDDIHFTEYTKNGFPTYFTITKKEEHKLFCFKLKNKNMTGKWQGKFFTSEDGTTCIEFIEEISFVNPLLSFIGMFMNIKKIQENYIRDLQKDLQAIKDLNYS